MELHQYNIRRASLDDLSNLAKFKSLQGYDYTEEVFPDIIECSNLLHESNKTKDATQHQLPAEEIYVVTPAGNDNQICTYALCNHDWTKHLLQLEEIGLTRNLSKDQTHIGVLLNLLAHIFPHQKIVSSIPEVQGPLFKELKHSHYTTRLEKDTRGVYNGESLITATYTPKPLPSISEKEFKKLSQQEKIKKTLLKLREVTGLEWGIGEIHANGRLTELLPDENTLTGLEIGGPYAFYTYTAVHHPKNAAGALDMKFAPPGQIFDVDFTLAEKLRGKDKRHFFIPLKEENLKQILGAKVVAGEVSGYFLPITSRKSNRSLDHPSFNPDKQKKYEERDVDRRNSTAWQKAIKEREEKNRPGKQR